MRPGKKFNLLTMEKVEKPDGIDVYRPDHPITPRTYSRAKSTSHRNRFFSMRGGYEAARSSKRKDFT